MIVVSCWPQERRGPLVQTRKAPFFTSDAERGCSSLYSQRGPPPLKVVRERSVTVPVMFIIFVDFFPANGDIFVLVWGGGVREGEEFVWGGGVGRGE